MGWGVNEKQVFVISSRVAAKKQREKQIKQKQKVVQHEKKQTAKWKDELTSKKLQEKKKDEQKRKQQLQKKQQLKQLLAKEEQQMEKINKKKDPFENKKLTQAEILLIQQKRIAENEKGSSSSDSEGQENPNRATHEFQVAENVEQALNLLSLKDDKHPEKRFRAAFEQFCDKREPTFKLENPTMKRTKRLEILRKEFDKHPDNPFNRAYKAYNEK